MNIDPLIVKNAEKLYDGLELFGHGAKAHELSNVIKQHALLGTVAATIPLPGLDLAAMVANTWAMYVRINKVVGVSFGDNVLKSIASGIIANLASLIPGIALAMGAGFLLKFIPGIGTAGGTVVQAGANVAVMYVAGTVYLKALDVLIHSDGPLDEESIRRVADQISRDRAFVKNAYTEGKELARNR